MTTWQEHKQTLLRDPKFKKAYDALEPAYQLASGLIQARIDKKLTQQEVAKKAGVSREAIARLESGSGNPTIRTASCVAKALGKELRLVDIQC